MTATCDNLDCLKCRPLDGPAIPLDLALSPAYQEGIERGKRAAERFVYRHPDTGVVVDMLLPPGTLAQNGDDYRIRWTGLE